MRTAMSPLLIQLLRRVAVWSLTLAVVLLVGPRVLTELGLIGPTPEELVDGAARSLEVARTYGADEQLAPFAAAAKELETARDLARRGQRREARRAAATVVSLANEAQRLALSRREEERRRAEAIVKDVDRILNELEDLYGVVTRDLDKARVSRLLSLMKESRRVGAALFLANDQGNYRKVLQDEKATKEALAAARETLRSARR